ncbi:MAG TPA: hypothetical protein VGF60_15395 [Xanthobacteraceae bacterium]|jgi:hypothetical protein
MPLSHIAALAAFAWAVGALLGTRFKVLILPLAAMLGGMVIVPIAVAADQTIASIAISLIVFTLGLQLGYLSVIAARYSAAAFRRWWGG